MAGGTPKFLQAISDLELDTRGSHKPSGLEVDSRTFAPYDHKYEYSRPPRISQTQQQDVVQTTIKQRGPKFVGGLFIGFLAATIVVSAIVGGGLGASLSSCQRKTQNLETSSTTASTVTVTVSAASSVVPLATGTTLLSNYTPVSPLTIDTLYNDCDPNKTPTTAFGDTFSPLCGKDINNNVRSAEGGILGDIVGIVAYSFMDCMTACSSLNYEAKTWGSYTRCRSITFGTNMRNGTRALSANCWLKNGSLIDPSLALLSPVKQSAKLTSTIQ